MIHVLGHNISSKLWNIANGHLLDADIFSTTRAFDQRYPYLILYCYFEKLFQVSSVDYSH